MIVLDTHIWLWWITLDDRSLKHSWRSAIDRADSIGVSAISCFEVAWLVHHQRVEIAVPLEEWFEAALDGSGVALPSYEELAGRLIR